MTVKEEVLSSLEDREKLLSMTEKVVSLTDDEKSDLMSDLLDSFTLEDESVINENIKEFLIQDVFDELRKEYFDSLGDCEA